MTTFQAYAHDDAGNEVKIGPSLESRRAVLNSAINHGVDAEVRDETGAVTDWVAWYVTRDGNRFTVTNVIELPEQAVFTPPRRERPAQKRVNW